jgi:hypothetical protein
MNMFMMGQRFSTGRSGSGVVATFLFLFLAFWAISFPQLGSEFNFLLTERKLHVLWMVRLVLRCYGEASTAYFDFPENDLDSVLCALEVKYAHLQAGAACRQCLP